MQVEISDAVSERDKVKFTVQTKVRLPEERGGVEAVASGARRARFPRSRLPWG